jgi:hypothetical protein
MVAGQLLDGEGRYEDESAQYLGEFKGRNRHGVGKVLYSNKASYSGQFFDDTKHGHSLSIPTP